MQPVAIQSTLTVNDLRLHYHVEGTGPDVLFVHGWSASRRMWAHLSQPLAERYRCWSLDLPGCGDSDKPGRDWYSIPNFTASVRAFIAEHGLLAPRVVGHSMGGMIVLDLAARYPEVVERLVVINPVVTGRVRMRPLARPNSATRVIDWVLRRSPAVVEPLLGSPLGQRFGHLRAIRRRSEDFFKGTPDSLVGSGRAVVGYDVTPLLPRITAPALVIVSTYDLQVPSSEGRLAARHIPDARLHEMRTGHQASDDRPAELLNHLVGFLA